MLTYHPSHYITLYISLFFFFNDTATTEIYTLSLHDALPILFRTGGPGADDARGDWLAARHNPRTRAANQGKGAGARSEEHTSELQSQSNLVCRLLLEKKKKHKVYNIMRQ